MKILLTGGGTMGSVSPLLAIVEELKKQNEIEFLWLGTQKGPEKKVIENYKIPFKAIFSGKLRRYFSWQNFIDLFFIKIGLWQSFFILLKFKPDVILSAGSFVGVPVIFAGWLLHIPCLIHQLDIRLTLANKLTQNVTKKDLLDGIDLNEIQGEGEDELHQLNKTFIEMLRSIDVNKKKQHD